VAGVRKSNPVVARQLSLCQPLFFFALGLMAKPMLVTLPFVMMLLDYWPLNRIRNSEFGIRNFIRLLPEKLPFLALSAVSCVVTFLCQHHGGSVASLKNVPLHYRLENVPVAYAEYLLKMIWPAHLAVFYPLNPCPGRNSSRPWRRWLWFPGWSGGRATHPRIGLSAGSGFWGHSCR